MTNVQAYIGTLNSDKEAALETDHVDYHNAHAKFVGPHTVSLTFRDKCVQVITSQRFVIAVGGRPNVLDIPGAEYAITSDDFFQVPRSPGCTLVVGASCTVSSALATAKAPQLTPEDVALECAGLLTGFGYEATVMVRSILLRGYDQELAGRIGNYMENHGTTFIRPATPKSIAKQEDGRLAVTFIHDGEEKTEEYDTVLFAAGRTANTQLLGLDAAGVEFNRKNCKIPAIDERTNVSHIFAIGDVVDGRLELSPVAIRAGRLLAERLYAGSTATMNYDNVPSTVFTPLEYGFCGLTEEEAEARHGTHMVETFMTHFKPTYWRVSQREDNTCYMKLVCLKPDLKVLGFHVLGVEAGEITQGVAVAITCVFSGLLCLSLSSHSSAPMYSHSTGEG